MHLFSTDKGIARRSDTRSDEVELLDTEYDDLYTAIMAGALDEVRTARDRGKSHLLDLNILAPVRPSRLFQVGLNYQSHLDEVGLQRPEQPMWGVSDVNDALAGPGDKIELPEVAPAAVDHECEIAVVVGSRANRISAKSAWDVIAGVTGCNDVSARDLQREGLAKGELTAGKLCRGFKPFGSGLITADEAIEAPLELSLSVNGVMWQHADPSDMVFSIPQLIEIISASEELKPGDVIITGSPSGVGFLSGRFLQPGDVVEVRIDDLPPLCNTFVAATA